MPLRDDKHQRILPSPRAADDGSLDSSQLRGHKWEQVSTGSVSTGRRDIGKSEAKWSPSVSRDVYRRPALAKAKTPRFTDSEDETVARQNGDRRHSNDHPRSKERPEESDATGPAQAATGAECRDSKNGAIASAGRLLTTYCPDYTTRGVLSGVSAYSCKFWEILSTTSVDHRISEGRPGESAHKCWSSSSRWCCILPV